MGLVSDNSSPLCAPRTPRQNRTNGDGGCGERGRRQPVARGSTPRAGGAAVAPRSAPHRANKASRGTPLAKGQNDGTDCRKRSQCLSLSLAAAPPPPHAPTRVFWLGRVISFDSTASILQERAPNRAPSVEGADSSKPVRGSGGKGSGSREREAREANHMRRPEKRGGVTRGRGGPALRSPPPPGPGRYAQPHAWCSPCLVPRGAGGADGTRAQCETPAEL